jgi:hypothetical protein
VPDTNLNKAVTRSELNSGRVWTINNDNGISMVDGVALARMRDINIPVGAHPLQAAITKVPKGPRISANITRIYR